MAGGFVALAFDVAFRLVEPWPLKLVIDAVSRVAGRHAAQTRPTMDASVQTLILCGAAVVAISIGRAISNYWSAVCFALIGSRVAADLRARAFRHVQGLSMRHHTRASTGDTVQRLVGDVSRLQDVAVTAGLPLLGNLATLVAMTGILLWLDPLLSLVVVLAGGVFVLLSRASSGPITAAAGNSRKGEGHLATTAAQTLGAIREVQAYGLEDTISSGFRSSNQATLGTGVAALRLAAGLERRTDVLIGVATAVVLAGGGWRVMEHAITPGDLVIFLMYLKTGMKPLKDLAKQTGRIARATASGERVADLLEAQTDLPESAHARRLDNKNPDIVIDDVSAGHGDGMVLHGIHLTIPAGEHVAILGPVRRRKVHPGQPDPAHDRSRQGVGQGGRRGPAGPQNRIRAVARVHPAAGLRAVRCHPSGTTSGSAGWTPRTRRLRRLRLWPRPATSSVPFRTATTQCWAKRRRTSPAASGSGSPLPGPSSGGPRS